VRALPTFKAMTLRIDPSEHRRTIPQFNNTLLRVHPGGQPPVYTLTLSGPPVSYDDWREDWL